MFQAQSKSETERQRNHYDCDNTRNNLNLCPSSSAGRRKPAGSRKFNIHVLFCLHLIACHLQTSNVQLERTVGRLAAAVDSGNFLAIQSAILLRRHLQSSRPFIARVSDSDQVHCTCRMLRCHSI
jgi:hypothetical protein